MIPNWLVKRAALTPDQRAISFEGSTRTYRELYEEALEQAGRLRTAGLSEGSRAALLGGTSADMAVLIHACLLAGVEMVMLNARLTAEEIAYQLEDSAADLLLYEDPFEAMTASSPCRKLGYSAFTELPSKPVTPAAEWSYDRTLTIMYTSGTTGFPKGVRQTAGNHTASAVSAVLNGGLEPGDAWLHMMPLFHISGFSILARAVLYGTEVRLFRKFDAAAAADEICSGRVTGLSAVAVTLERLLQELEQKGRIVPPTFRTLLAGGGPVPVSYLERAQHLGLPVMQTYGMTETSSQTATLSARDALRKIGSSGKPLFFAEIRIDGAGQPFEKGEILIRGPHVTGGYIGRHAETSALQDGWLHSGDIGYFDGEGFLFVSDRRSDLIISGGENIYPAEIEAVLAAHPAVREAGVCAMASEEWGAVPAAFITPASPVTAEELEAYCRSRLAAYKVPKTFRMIDEMPRNASNKLMRSKLRELLDGQ
ncbi:2-succinylbenzoate--CoA ligase [Sporosarcina sp. NCCP-2716]|uniref:o-succinylbenzoate--CoA ligase n=1 Tax=Sporosarcina sp. NCCP-2716 TaxID=2943679 RepID=UPI00203AED3A|nr:o-succinylbenzoate--CoA ligase [Sporosarcina sp. NCCP-2716]GKV69420.1 2-succinylbenzoate--CoA ligase [Sporosarcina sp. NCCP-2716]